MSRFGAFGDSLESATRTDFFRWFHFEQTWARKEAAELQVIEFRPSGDRFRNLASLKVTCESTGYMLGLELMLDRGFIESSNYGIFAADCAKSFLLSATSGDNFALVKPLAEEIQHGAYRRSGRPVLSHVDAPRATPPEEPSLGYETYLGQREQWVQVRPIYGMQLWLRNESLEKRRILVMSLR